MKNLIFFCLASAILLFSIVTINIVPNIGGIGGGFSWMTSSCKYHSDQYDVDKEKDWPSEDLKDAKLKSDKKVLDRCNRKQAMVGLEYTSLIVNIFIGFVCAFLGLLLYFNLGNLGKIPGLIGLVGGAVGFILTFVYVIESGLVFDDIEDANNLHLRIDSDGACLKWDESRNSYTCNFYDKDNKDSIYLKFSDYGNKYLSYNKDIYYNNDKYRDLNHANGCNLKPETTTSSSSIFNTYDIVWEKCKEIDEKKPGAILYPKKENCDKIYYFTKSNTQNNRKILYDRWLTSIILSCFIFLFNIGLAIFGFLLFKESNGSSGSVAIK